MLRRAILIAEATAIDDYWSRGVVLNLSLVVVLVTHCIAQPFRLPEANRAETVMLTLLVATSSTVLVPDTEAGIVLYWARTLMLLIPFIVVVVAVVRKAVVLCIVYRRQWKAYTEAQQQRAKAGQRRSGSGRQRSNEGRSNSNGSDAPRSGKPRTSGGGGAGRGRSGGKGGGRRAPTTELASMPGQGARRHGGDGGDKQRRQRDGRQDDGDSGRRSTLNPVAGMDVPTGRGNGSVSLAV